MQAPSAAGPCQAVQATKVLRELAKKNAEKAYRTLQYMQQEMLEPNVFHFSSIIGSNWTLALSLIFHQMRQQLVQCNVVTYNAAMDASCRGWHWDLAMELLHNMPSRTLEPDMYSDSTLLRSLPWCFATTMLQRAALAACNSAMKACEAQWQAALRTMQLAKLQLSLDTVSYGAALSACASSGLWQRAARLLGGMRAEQVVADLICFNCVTSSYETGGRWPFALVALGAYWPPSLVSYTSAMSSCHRGTHWQTALCLLSSVQRRLRASRACLNCALSACARGTLWQQALAMISEDTPDATGVSAAIQALGQAQWSYVLQLLRLPQLDAVCYNSALGILGAAGRWQLCLEVLMQMQVSHTELSVSSYSPGISACAAQLLWRHSLALLSQMQFNEVAPDALSLAFVLASRPNYGFSAALLTKVEAVALRQCAMGKAINATP
ncbi:unnamed protein product [Effrenium voratum]|nr:unnamed protein product [Effrenium voratum]